MPTKSGHQAPALLGASMSPGPGAQSSAATATPPARHDLSSLGEPLSPTRAPRRGAGGREDYHLSLPLPVASRSLHARGPLPTPAQRPPAALPPHYQPWPPRCAPAPVPASAPARPPATLFCPPIAAKNASSSARTRITTGSGAACPRISACFLVSRLASTVRSPAIRCGTKVGDDTWGWQPPNLCDRLRFRPRSY